MYDQPITGRRTRQRNEFQALATIDEARDPPVESTSSDSHFAFESSPEGEDSESGMVLLTPPSQRSPAPASTARGSPAPKSAGAHQAALHPVCPPHSLLLFLISLPFLVPGNRTPAPRTVCRLQGTKHLAASPTPLPLLPHSLPLYPCPETSKHPAVLELPPTLPSLQFM